MRHFKLILLTSLTFVLTASDVFASRPIEVYMEISTGGQFVEPASKTIRVRVQPMPFRIIVKNRSAVSQRIYTSVDDGYSAISLEISDSYGRKSYVTKRVGEAYSNFRMFVFLDPGQVKSFPMNLDSREWDGLEIRDSLDGQKFRIRAIYEDEGGKIYSESYTAIFPKLTASE